MGNWERSLLVIAGAILLLPATCSVAFTPMTIMSLSGYEVGSNDPRSVFAGRLFWVSLGFAVALGGVRLLHASKRGTWSDPFPRWLSLLTGLVLLLPGVSAAFAIWAAVSRAVAGGGTRDEDVIFLAVTAPIFVVLGVYNLWRASRPRAA